MRRTWRFSTCVVLASATLAIAVAEQYSDATCAKDSVGMVQTRIDKPEKVRSGAVIFYNLFINENENIPIVSAMVKEQLELIPDPTNTEIRINSIGAEPMMSDFNLSSELEKRTTIMAHYPTGWENVTLHDLWSFCRKKGTDPNQLVVYLHSKGSFSGFRDPGVWKQQSFHRGYVTRGALSQECLHMPKYCNICSTRMMPFPYTQTPGNMWAARCGYVANLKNPLTFGEDMMKTPDDIPNVRTFGMAVSFSARFCTAKSRYAHEHWVYSHPNAAPCDLDTNTSRSYGDAPPWYFSSDFEKDLKKAPRFNLETYRWRRGYCLGVGEALSERLKAYRILYGKEPAADWWGWSFFGAEPPVR